MSDSTTSAIEDKQNTSSDSTTDTTTKQNEWGKFIAATITNIIISIIFGFFGANFIFFSTAPSLELEQYFPTNESSYFPTTKSTKKSFFDFLGGQEKQTAKPRYSCYKRPHKDFNLDFLKSIGLSKAGGWPYSMYKDEAVPGIFQSYKNWFAKSIAHTFIMTRNLLQKWVGLFSPDKPIFSNETLQMFVIAPMTLFFGQFITAALGFFGFIYESFVQEWKWSLLGLLLGYTTFIALLVMFVEVVKFLFSFLLLPAISNYKLLGEILKCNANSIAMLFGAMMVSSANTYLNSTISSSMIVVYIILLIKQIFF